MKLKRPQYLSWLLIFGSLIIFALLFIKFIIALLLLPILIISAYFTQKQDTIRRTSIIIYNSNETNNKDWIAICATINLLIKSNKLWVISNVFQIDPKHNAGLPNYYIRPEISFTNTQPPYISSNISPYYLYILGKQFYFFPDNIYLYSDNKYSSISYRELSLSFDCVQLIEIGNLPNDAQVIGNYWLHANKDGSSDQRFSGNRIVPKVTYGSIKLTLGYQHVYTIHVSNLELAKLAVQTISPQTENNTSKQKQEKFNSGQQSNHYHKDNKKQRSETNYKKESSYNNQPYENPSKSKCLSVLGISVDCSQEEAQNAYRNLVKLYHPDKVSHLGHEFGELANEKMKEINWAYTELMRINGWK